MTLVKIDSQHWLSLLENVFIPPAEEHSENNNSEHVDSVHNLPQPPTSTLGSEMEDCDFGDANVQSEFSIGEH